MLALVLVGSALAAALPARGQSPKAAGPPPIPAIPVIPASPPEVRDLLAQGNQDRHDGLEMFWLARVVTDTTPGAAPANLPPASVTHFHALRAGSSAWQEWGEGVPMRAVSLASRGSQLAALLEDGSWLLLSNDSTSTGRRLPVPGDLIAFGDDGRTLWALAKLPGGIARLRAATPTPSTSSTTPAPAAPRTGPATAASVVSTTAPRTTGPTTAPARVPAIGPAPEVPLSLLSFGSEGWSGEADLPAEVARPGDAVSLTFIADEAYVAARALRARGEVHLYHWADDEPKDKKGTKAGRARHWAPVATIPLPADARAFQLLDGTPVPTLWVGGNSGPDLLYLLRPPAGESSSALSPPASAPAAAPPQPIELAGTKGAPVAMRTAAYAMGLIRSLYPHDGKLTEQAYDRLTGAAVGKPTPVVLQGQSAFAPGQWKYAVVALAMLYAIGASFRRREQMRSMNVDPAALHLAPLGVRMLAGVIDALPVIVAWAYYANRIGAAEFAGAVVGGAAGTPFAELVLGVAVAVYLLHTTLSELLTGRTLGKMIFGLRVVSLDGMPPTRNQILTRNLLRVVDAGLVFLPVLLVPFSPLRQRPGDTAAGTLVVSGSTDTDGTRSTDAVQGSPDDAAGGTSDRPPAESNDPKGD